MTAPVTPRAYTDLEALALVQEALKEPLARQLLDHACDAAGTALHAAGFRELQDPERSTRYFNGWTRVSARAEFQDECLGARLQLRVTLAMQGLAAAFSRTELRMQVSRAPDLFEHEDEDFELLAARTLFTHDGVPPPATLNQCRDNVLQRLGAVRTGDQAVDFEAHARQLAQLLATTLSP